MKKCLRRREVDPDMLEQNENGAGEIIFKLHVCRQMQDNV